MFHTKDDRTPSSKCNETRTPFSPLQLSDSEFIQGLTRYMRCTSCTHYLYSKIEHRGAGKMQRSFITQTNAVLTYICIMSGSTQMHFPAMNKKPLVLTFRHTFFMNLLEMGAEKSLTRDYHRLISKLNKGCVMFFLQPFIITVTIIY